MDCPPKLLVISSVGVGYNHIDVSAASVCNIRVGNTPRVQDDTTADHAFAILMASARSVVQGTVLQSVPIQSPYLQVILVFEIKVMKFSLDLQLLQSDVQQVPQSLEGGEEGRGLISDSKWGGGVENTFSQ